MGMFFTICIFLILFLIAWIDGKNKKDSGQIACGVLARRRSVPFRFSRKLKWQNEEWEILWRVSVPLLMLNLIRPGAFGGGDIKLSAVSGMFLGWRRMADAFLLALFMAGGYAFRLLAGKKRNEPMRLFRLRTISLYGNYDSIFHDIYGKIARIFV